MKVPRSRADGVSDYRNNVYYIAASYGELDPKKVVCVCLPNEISVALISSGWLIKRSTTMAENKKLFIYEALELRSEYDARIKTFKDTLPETRQNRDRLFFARDDDGRRRPSSDFDMAEVRRQLRKLEVKRRKLNGAIQQANFNSQVEYHGESINLNEALETRKSLNEQIGELHTQVVNSAYEKVIYKEGRDIIEANELSYASSVDDLDHARLAFRELNRKLRKASFNTFVEFTDE